MWAQSAAEIGQIITTARRHHRMTQVELARALGTTQGWVSEVEQGKETAHIGKVLRALSHLGVRLRTGTAPWDEHAHSTAAPASSSDEPVSLAHVISRLSQPEQELSSPQEVQARIDKVSQTGTPRPSNVRDSHTLTNAPRTRRQRKKR
jgi:y4mF family transcriptional regulator